MYEIFTYIKQWNKRGNQIIAKLYRSTACLSPSFWYASSQDSSWEWIPQAVATSSNGSLDFSIGPGHIFCATIQQWARSPTKAMPQHYMGIVHRDCYSSSSGGHSISCHDPNRKWCPRQQQTSLQATAGLQQLRRSVFPSSPEPVQIHARELQTTRQTSWTQVPKLSCFHPQPLNFGKAGTKGDALVFLWLRWSLFNYTIAIPLKMKSHFS